MQPTPIPHFSPSRLLARAKNYLRFILVSALVLLVLYKTKVFSTSTDPRADFVFVPRGDVKTLDLAKMSYLDDIRLANALWEGLYTLDPVTLDPVPGCAFPIDISPDKKTYTFHIRPEAKWTNGDPVLAKDFLFGWKRIMDEQGEYSYLLNYMDGAEEYQKAVDAKQKDPSVKPNFSICGFETRADDPRYLRVKLKDPTTFFPDLCAFPPFFPSHEASMVVKDAAGNPQLDFEGKLMVSKTFTRPPHLVTNGPYRLDLWEFKRKLRLVASDFYWNRASTKSRTIEMRIDDDQQNGLSAYDSGAVDWLSEVQSNFAVELRRRGRTDLKAFAAFGTYFYSFNCQEKLPDGRDNPFHKVAVRKALSMGIDKQFIVDHITRMGEPVATGYIPPGVFKGYQSPKGLAFNIDEARKLLAEAGYPDGAGFPEVKINFNLEEIRHKEIAEFLQREWKKNLNINLSLDGKELKTFGEQLRNKQYDISRASWYGDYNDISTFTDKYLPDSGGNDAAWKNQKYAELCQTAAHETDEAKRRVLFQEAEQILVDEAPILPIFHYMNTYMFHDNVRGIPLNARQSIMLNAVEVIRK
jgi:oligopeptide transport system substrate-binding protein